MCFSKFDGCHTAIKYLFVRFCQTITKLIGTKINPRFYASIRCTVQYIYSFMRLRFNWKHRLRTAWLPVTLWIWISAAEPGVITNKLSNFNLQPVTLPGFDAVEWVCVTCKLLSLVVKCVKMRTWLTVAHGLWQIIATTPLLSSLLISLSRTRLVNRLSITSVVLRHVYVPIKFANGIWFNCLNSQIVAVSRDPYSFELLHRRPHPANWRSWSATMCFACAQSIMFQHKINFCAADV